MYQGGDGVRRRVFEYPPLGYGRRKRDKRTVCDPEVKGPIIKTRKIGEVLSSQLKLKKMGDFKYSPLALECLASAANKYAAEMGSRIEDLIKRLQLEQSTSRFLVGPKIAYLALQRIEHSTNVVYSMPSVNRLYFSGELRIKEDDGTGIQLNDYLLEDDSEEGAGGFTPIRMHELLLEEESTVLSPTIFSRRQ